MFRNFDIRYDCKANGFKAREETLSTDWEFKQIVDGFQLFDCETTFTVLISWGFLMNAYITVIHTAVGGDNIVILDSEPIKNIDDDGQAIVEFVMDKIDEFMD